VRSGAFLRAAPSVPVAGGGAGAPAAGAGADASEPARIPLRIVAPHSLTGRPDNGSADRADEDALLRLGIWLAEVSMEAASAATEQKANGPPGPSAPGPTASADRPLLVQSTN